LVLKKNKIANQNLQTLKKIIIKHKKISHVSQISCIGIKSCIHTPVEKSNLHSKIHHAFIDAFKTLKNTSCIHRCIQNIKKYTSCINRCIQNIKKYIMHSKQRQII